MTAIARLLSPRSVAVVGASADAAKMTGRPVSYLLRHGFTGAIYPVNPRVSEIAGLRCYPDVAALPEAPDAAIVLLGPERAELGVEVDEPLALAPSRPAGRLGVDTTQTGHGIAVLPAAPPRQAPPSRDRQRKFSK